MMPHDHSADANDHPDNSLDPLTARVMALETLLTGKGPVDLAALDRIINTNEHRVGPRNGARVVARAWTDPEFAD